MCPTPDPTIDPTSDPSRPGAALTDDAVSFLEDMLALLHSAARLSDMAGSRSRRPDVVSLAALIETSQHRQIAAITTCLRRGGRARGAVPALGQSPMLGWMRSEVDADHLAPLSGTPFDTDFLTVMVAHQQAAVDRSRTAMVDGLVGEGRDLARSTVHDQSREQRLTERLVGARPL